MSIEHHIPHPIYGTYISELMSLILRSISGVYRHPIVQMGLLSSIPLNQSVSPHSGEEVIDHDHDTQVIALEHLELFPASFDVD